MDNINLYHETWHVLRELNLTEYDVLWVGTNEWHCTWSEFQRAADFDYDSGYGLAEINEELMVVGHNWYLERREYDGSEGWEFCKVPTRPKYLLEGKEIIQSELKY